MQHHTTIVALRQSLASERAGGRTVGVVPTMGFLHAGHVSLIERAARECDAVVLTVFVNPLQFAPGEDLSAYPRDPEGDAAKASGAGATILFAPEAIEMYPEPVLTTVSVAGVSDAMEGATRPTHFSGVATVVAKLFAIVGESRAYFGEKDYQQLAVVRAMARDLSIPVDVVGCPIVREPDGLALSSRNVYLTTDARHAAPVLRRALAVGAGLIGGGVTDADEIRRAMADVVGLEPEAELDYAEVADARTLAPVTVCDRGARLLIAARFGRARLIDNISAGEE
jgi:pantoate--beta-alanine ligase